ncbi:MAG: DEAD/DEAH box helicase [Succinivibrio sp.]|nr:DEAD/DEAH box helicase [Succinivibrio sp.]
MALFRQICHDNEVPCLVERSRSGNGAHVWIIFEGDVPAHLAREFGRRLLLRGAAQTKRRLFHFFDRMMPMQEHCSPGDLGNLIALPLQGKALSQGNSAFVDENWQAYPNQWRALCTTTRLTPGQVEAFLALWQEGELSTLVEQQDEEPILEDEQEMVGRDASAALKLLPRNAGALRLRPDGAPHGVKVILGGGLKIHMGELTGSFVNALRYLASMSNPKFYSNLRQGRSNFRVPRRLYFDVDDGDCLVLPRGLKEALEQKLDEAGIALEIRDERCAGHSIEVSFTGQLHPEQEPAAAAMLKHEDGVLKAATGFGKSVVGAYLIAQRKVSTLVLVTKLNILEQWRTSLGFNLDFGAAERTYTTRGGKTRKCQSDDFVGILSGNKYQLTHVVDVASTQSLTSKEEALELFGHYGMVIVDECHHEAAPTLFDLLRRVPCTYLYGLTANLARSDNLNRLPLMLLGPIRYHYSAKDQARDQKLPRRVRPRYTRTVSPRAEQLDHHGLLNLVMQDSQRSAQIAAEAAEYARAGRFVLVLTLRVDHANLLHDLIKKRFPETYLLTGQSPDRAQLYCALATRDNPSFVLVSTSQYGGEGMDIPRLDTLLLAMPATNKLTQLTGRITRMHPDKRDLLVVDYVDGNVPIAAHMFSKRKRIYQQNGYTLEQVGRERELSQGPGSVPPLVAAFEGLPVAGVQEQGSVVQGSESAGAAAGMGQAGTTKDAVTEATEDASAGSAAAATALANSVAFFSDPQQFCQQLKVDLLGARDAEFYLSSLPKTDLTLLWDLTAAAYTQGCKMTVVVNDDPDNDEHSKRVGIIKERGLYVGYVNYLTADFIVVDQQVLWRGFSPLLGPWPSGGQVIREVNSDMVAAMRERMLNKVLPG